MKTIDQECILFETNYQITSQDYMDFSQILFKEFINQKIKKSYITSFVTIILSVIFITYIFVTKQYNKYFVYFLILFMLIMNLYSVLFYKKIFPKSLKKNSKKSFPTTKFYNQNINLKFFKDYLIETINNNQTKIIFSDIIKTQIDNNLIILKTNEQYLIIPKNIISDNLLIFLYKNFNI